MARMTLNALINESYYLSLMTARHVRVTAHAGPVYDRNGTGMRSHVHDPDVRALYRASKRRETARALLNAELDRRVMW